MDGVAAIRPEAELLPNQKNLGAPRANNRRSSTVKFEKVLVGIPSYNCAEQIPRVLAGFSGPLLDRITKVLIIDNGSTDGTVAAVKQFISSTPSPKFELIQNDLNYGLGGTHKVAFLRAERERVDYVAILHGDNQARTEELATLLDVAASAPDTAAILGSRFMAPEKLHGYSKIRLWGNRGLNFLFTVLTKRRTLDLGSGLNLFRLADLRDREYLELPDGFTFNMSLLLHYRTHEREIAYVPISWSHTDQRSNARTFRVGWLTLKALLEWYFGFQRPNPHRPEDFRGRSFTASSHQTPVANPPSTCGSPTAITESPSPRPSA